MVRREAEDVEQAQRVPAGGPYEAVMRVARESNLRLGQRRRYRVALAGYGHETLSDWATVTVVAEAKVEIRVLEDGQDISATLFSGKKGDG